VLLLGAFTRPSPQGEESLPVKRKVPNAGEDGQIRLAPILMASASTAVLKKNDSTACSVASLRSDLLRMETSEVCDAAPNDVAKYKKSQ